MNEHKEKPTFEFHFHDKVGQNIANVEHMEVHFDKDMQMQVQNVEKMSAAPSSPLPPELATPEAVRLLDLAKENGWLDDQYQPQLPTKVQIALLAGRINELLWDTNHWAVFEKLWGQQRLIDSFTDGLGSEKQQDFWNSLTDRLK